MKILRIGNTLKHQREEEPLRLLLLQDVILQIVYRLLNVVFVQEI